MWWYPGSAIVYRRPMSSRVLSPFTLLMAVIHGAAAHAGFGAYRKLLGSKQARRTLADTALHELVAPVPGLQADLKTLMASEPGRRRTGCSSCTERNRGLERRRYEPTSDRLRSRPCRRRRRARIRIGEGQGEGEVQEGLQHHATVLQTGLSDGAALGAAAGVVSRSPVRPELSRRVRGLHQPVRIPVIDAGRRSAGPRRLPVVSPLFRSTASCRSSSRRRENLASQHCPLSDCSCTVSGSGSDGDGRPNGRPVRARPFALN